MTETTKQTNNVERLAVLLRIMQDAINDNDLVGIAIWSDESFSCMTHIELDNGL